MAIGAGYLLGRTHKARLALALGAAAASGQLDRAPGGLVEQGTKALISSGPLSGLQEPGERLVEAGKAAATAAVTSRINSVSDRLQQRAESLRAPDVLSGVSSGKGGKEEQEPPEQAKQQRQEPEAKQKEESRPESGQKQDALQT